MCIEKRGDSTACWRDAHTSFFLIRMGVWAHHGHVRSLITGHTSIKWTGKVVFFGANSRYMWSCCWFSVSLSFSVWACFLARERQYNQSWHACVLNHTHWILMRHVQNDPTYEMYHETSSHDGALGVSLCACRNSNFKRGGKWDRDPIYHGLNSKKWPTSLKMTNAQNSKPNGFKS